MQLIESLVSKSISKRETLKIKKIFKVFLLIAGLAAFTTAITGLCFKDTKDY